MALKKAASPKAASDLIPARSNSVFFTVTLSLVARCFIASNTSYSALGKVKLSRTNFGFLSFAGLTAAVLTAGDLRATGDFATGDFFAAGFAAVLFVVAVFAATWVAEAAARLTGARLAATGLTFLATVEVVINKFPLQELKSEWYI
jgi:hypothetical protein